MPTSPWCRLTYGGVVRARAIAKRLECDLAIIDKRRPKPNVAKVMHIIGEVKDRTCVIMDDMVDTANTLCEAARALKEQGAKRVMAYCTHAVLSGAGDRAHQCNSALDELVVTDTIPAARGCQPAARFVSYRWLNCWRRPSAVLVTRIR
jgi:ribose-phosphate pyrophosphokinase